MKITLLDDEFSLRNNIKEFLEFHHYVVDAYADGTTLLEECRFDADLYILDINVPGADGFEIIEWISRNAPDTPVIFITAFTDIESISKAYTLGCSDYLKKPFDLTELLLRVGRLLQKENAHAVQLSPECIFEMQTRELQKNGHFIKLSKTQRNILYLLIKHKNKIVTYDMLIDHVWEGHFIKHNTIASHIREIRHITPELLIQSIRSEGYLLKL
ncbi:MAG: response regulator transcription factor [Campylobacterota bacterium]|nr:response regulator transcription factor [Campylobacterota bacterium]